MVPPAHVPTRRLGAPVLLAAALVLVVALGAALINREQGRRHHEVDARLGEQARMGAAMIAALRESTVDALGLQYTERLGTGRVSRARLDALATHRGARFAVILGPSGRTVAASTGSPMATGSRAEDPNFRLVGDSATIAAPIGRRTLVLGLPRKRMTDMLTAALVRLPSAWPADRYAVDARGSVVSEWGVNGHAPGGLHLRAADLRRAARIPVRDAGAATSAAPIAGTSWSFAVRAPRTRTDAGIRGAALMLPWALLLAISLAATCVVALLLRGRRARAALESERERATAVLSVLSDGYLFVRGGRVIDVNDRLCELTGYTREELVGLGEEHPLVAAITAAGDGQPDGEGVLVRGDGNWVEVAVTSQAAPGSALHGPGRVSVVRDIARQKRTERRLSRLASTDALTGLANRGAFDTALHAAAAEAREHGRPLSLVVFDVDAFKSVNDRFGHPVGDRVLAEVGRRLATQAREGEVVARIGGEEFAWILPGLSQTEALEAAERVRARVGATLFPEAGRLTLSAGVGLLGTGDAPGLYALADAALLRAKREGRDRTVAATGPAREAAPVQVAA